MQQACARTVCAVPPNRAAASCQRPSAEYRSSAQTYVRRRRTRGWVWSGWKALVGACLTAGVRDERKLVPLHAGTRAPAHGGCVARRATNIVAQAMIRNLTTQPSGEPLMRLAQVAPDPALPHPVGVLRSLIPAARPPRRHTSPPLAAAIHTHQHTHAAVTCAHGSALHDTAVHTKRCG